MALTANECTSAQTLIRHLYIPQTPGRPVHWRHTVMIRRDVQHTTKGKAARQRNPLHPLLHIEAYMDAGWARLMWGKYTHALPGCLLPGLLCRLFVLPLNVNQCI